MKDNLQMAYIFADLLSIFFKAFYLQMLINSNVKDQIWEVASYPG